MRKLRNIFISGILSICMVVTSLPIELLAQEAETVQADNGNDGQENIHSDGHQDTRREIISFTELPESVRNQNASLGTTIEELELPGNLTASYRSFKEKTEDNKNPEETTEEESGEKPTEETAGDKDDEKPAEETVGDKDDKKPTEETTGDKDDEKPTEETVGDKDDEKPSEETTEDKDKGKTPEEIFGEESNDNISAENQNADDDSSQTQDEKSENETENQTPESFSEIQAGKSEVEPTASVTKNSGKAELEIEQKTVEVHMKEYNSQPEDMVAPKTLVSESPETLTDLNKETGSVEIEVNADSGLSEEPKPESDSAANLSEEISKETGSETSPEANTSKKKNEENQQKNSTETIVLSNITWISTPEYDGNAEGVYIFTPVIAEDYVLAEDAALPEIIVTVEDMEEAAEPDNDMIAANPACGTISSDTVWDGSATLSNGELIVEPGVTLTINDIIIIEGNVTIKGGGTIKRGSGNAYFSVASGANFTVGEITLEGNSTSSYVPMILVRGAKLTLDDGCRIQNCNTNNWYGSALYMWEGEAVLNNVTIENCSSDTLGRYDASTVLLEKSVMTVNGGAYRNNKAKGIYAASVINNWGSKLYIYGGIFINNTVYDSRLGGCILDSGQIRYDFSNETHLYGGYFEGNKSDCTETSDGGAIHYISRSGDNVQVDESVIFEIAGDVRFCGDGEDSGTDSFYLDCAKYARKIYVGAPLVSPVHFYLNAQEGYVIAKGSANGYILTEKDMKQIHFTDVGDSGKKWYAWLDEENNEIRLSEEVPPYGLYVYYSSNGATGKVEDNTEYASGADVTVKSAETLTMKGHIFKEWNTKPDGTGTPYTPGTVFKITDDITLYAIFVKGKILTADFYSGEADSKEIITEKFAQGADTVTITAPELKDMEGWHKLGWNLHPDSYTADIAAGATIEISEDASYYGIYEKDVTLSYDANGADTKDALPASETKKCYANVHEEAVTYKPALTDPESDPDSFEFEIAPDISQDGYEFFGWNTKPDGTGTFYRAQDTTRNKISITGDTVLYAILKIPPAATFYSGDAIYRETIVAKFTDGVNATLTAPELAEMDGWVPVGWSTDGTGYLGSIKAGSVISLSENTSYYGIYKKEVELSYDANNWTDDNPLTQSGVSYAKVQNDITYAPVSLNVAPAITRVGYSFVGWSASKDVTAAPDSDYYRPNESIEIEDSVTLYAHMIDDIAPVLGEASYNSGYTDVGNWLVHKKDMVITVPITEEGSGVNKIIYALTPENGETVTGEALMTEAYVPRQVRQTALVQLDVTGGKMNVAYLPSSAAAQDTTTDGQPGTADGQPGTADGQPGTTGGQVVTTDGQIRAIITIAEDYKGTVSLKCIDNAGNES
ncbi:MAG: InlB B-repeat-containing protein, partial [Lachnospiraceae bacterium]|nr:InlB B-repeat-containing protein [Lachnospiraceae bacterium]